jgi:hypothetical protein
LQQLISALAFLDLVARSLCVQLTAFAQARLCPPPDRAASAVRRTPVHECVKMLAPIVIAITPPVLISLVLRNYRRSIRAAPIRAPVAQRQSPS